MVKRPKSPELTEDARFFTVYQPYPINANWTSEEEQKKCSMWVAECIGLNYLWAIHYKPKARGMILLEVSKNFRDHGRLLGEHRWGDILKNPDELEKKSVTQVFHCFYSRLRDCQKDGWKAVPIQNSWFKGWTPGQGDFKRPYPPTHWCQVPAEDRTNKSLCRPLPSEAKTPPPPHFEQQVVGSSNWVVDKQTDAPPTPSAMSNAGAKKTPPLDARGTKSPSPSFAPQHSAGPSAASASGSKLPPAKNPRAKPVPLNACIAGEPSTGNAWGKPPAVNNFATNDPQGSANAWSKKLSIPPSEKSPRAPISPSPYDKDYSAWTTPSNSTPHSPPQSLASRLSSRIPEDPPPPRSRRGKGKERDNGRQPAWKRNGQWSEDKSSKEPVYSLADTANRKPPTRAEIDATLRPWERGKVDYARLGVVDEPEPPTNLDWKMDPPTNDWNKPLAEEKTSNTEWKVEPSPANDWNKPLAEEKTSNTGWKVDPSPANDWNKPLAEEKRGNTEWKVDPSPANDWNKPLTGASSSNAKWKMGPRASDRNKPRDEASSSYPKWKTDPPANDRNKPRDKAGSRNLNWKMDPPANDWNKPLDEAGSSNLNWKMDPPANDWNKPLDESSSANLDWKMDPPANDWNKPLDEASSSNLDWKMDPPANNWNKPLDEASSTNLDWKMDPPADDWNKPFVEGSSNNDTSFSSAPSYDKKRKPDGQFNRDGEPQYDRYGEPSNRYDSRKRAAYGYSEYSSRGGGNSYPDRGRGRGFGRGGYRGKPNAWDARRDASGPRYKEVGVKWYSGRKNGDSDATSQTSKEGKPDGGNTDDNHTKDTFKYPSYYEKPIGTSWGDTPVTGTEAPAAEFKYPAYYEKPIGTSWGDLPITTTSADDSESKDWAAGADGAVEGEGKEGEWTNGEGEEADAIEEPPNSDQEEGYEDGGEYREYDENEHQPEATEEEPTTTSATDWGSGPTEVRGPNDWGLAPGEKKVNSWGFPEPEETTAEDNPWAKKPATDASAWFADGIIPANLQDWDKVPEEDLQPNQPQVEELICPTHNIACRKGFCSDMAQLIRERDMAQWMRTRGRGRGRPNGGRGWGDPRGPRGTWGAKEVSDDQVVTYKRTRRGNRKNKHKPTIGVMRGFEDGTTASADGRASEIGAGGHDGNETGSDG